MYIYLAQAEIPCPHCGGKVVGLCKIGRSLNPKRRVRSIAPVPYQHTVRLICSVWAGPSRYAQLEEALHMLFADKWHHGEWFDLSVSNVEFVKGLTTGTIDKLLVARETALGRKGGDPRVGARAKPIEEATPIRPARRGLLADVPHTPVDEGLDWRTWVYGGARNPIHNI